MSARYLLTWRFPATGPRRAIATVSFQREQLGPIDVVDTRVLMGDELDGTPPGLTSMIEALLIDHLDRAPDAELVATVIAALDAYEITVDELDQVLAHGVTQQLFAPDPGEPT